MNQPYVFRFLVWLAVVASITPISLGQTVAQPNIILVLVDDLGVMDTSVPFLSDAQGRAERHPLNDFYRTPNLERLAKQGIRFSTFYAMSVCSPTRVSIMTGQTSARHQTTNWINPETINSGKFGPRDWNWQGLNEQRMSLARILRDSGYRTIHCGKGHFGPFDSVGSNPGNLGFEVNIGGSGAGQPGSYYGSKDFGNGTGPRARWGVPSLAAHHGREIFLTEALTQEFNRAISAAVQEGKPFFGYFAHYAVHAPFQADPRFAGNYAGQPADLVAFASLVEGMDKSVGDVLAHLEKLDVAENTLVIFLGDNGTDSPRGDQFAISCAAPLRGKKGTQYEGGMRVPFIAAWARPSDTNPLQKKWPIQSAGLTNELGAVYDLFPTILQVSGCPVPEECQPIDGVDLWPTFRGSNASGQPRDFLMHYPYEHRGSYFTVFRRGNWKLVYHYRKPLDKRFELFDLSQDPSESNNLAASQPEHLDRMLSAMQDALRDTGAQYPLADDQKTPLKPSRN